MNSRASTYGLGLIILMTCPLMGCIEPFETEFIDFESALVINATITNQFKHQEILVSRTYEFEEEGPTGESNAKVKVVAGNGTTYDFNETEKGKYVSNAPFSAELHIDYVLNITTEEGYSYISDEVQLSNFTKIDSLYAERMTTDLGEEGMGIMINSFDATNSSKYYRYEYEETYRIVAPRFVGRDLVAGPEGWLFPGRPIDEKTCYSTDFSNRIILTDTEDLSEGRLSRFLVRFVNRENYIISHRYSILVRQYVQSFEAFNFYETLNNFSSSESLFSETQPGFLEGNLFSNENRNEKVLGYFDVAAVDQRRIFFDYEEFFPGEPLPPYVDPCTPSSPEEGKLFNQLDLNLIKYLDTNPNPEPTTGPFFIVPRVCGDCTALGTPEVPEFWIE